MAKFDKSKEAFIRAYCQGFHGSYDEQDWRAYLIIVYVKANGNVKQFNLDRSIEKFKNACKQGFRFQDIVVQIIREGGHPYEVYREFQQQRLAYVEQQGDDYGIAYHCL